MKALWLESQKNVQYGEKPDPIPPAGWVRLRVAAASICGSDLKSYKNGRPYKLDRRVSGHEFAGVIDMVADESSMWKVGQRVCVHPMAYCNECDECKEGHINTCTDMKYIGGRTYDGGFAEYAVVPEYLLMEVPETVSDIEAAMIEPFAVGLHAVNQAGGAALKDKAVIIYGAGPIGLFAMEAAKYYEAGIIIVIDVVTEKLEIAKEHGADYVISGSQSSENLIEKVKEITGGRGADAVIDAVCLGVTVDNAMHFCKPHGIVSVVGMTMTNFDVDFQYLLKNEITIRGSYTYGYEMRDCLKMMQSGSISIEYIANPVMKLSEGVEAYRKVVEEPDKCIKAVLIPDSYSNSVR